MKKKAIELVKRIVRDTLMKRVGNTHRFSRTSFIMFNAWMLVVYYVIYDLYAEGFRFDVFMTLVSVSLGVKLNDALFDRIKKLKK